MNEVSEDEMIEAIKTAHDNKNNVKLNKLANKISTWLPREPIVMKIMMKS